MVEQRAEPCMQKRRRRLRRNGSRRREQQDVNHHLEIISSCVENVAEGGNGGITITEEGPEDVVRDHMKKIATKWNGKYSFEIKPSCGHARRFQLTISHK